MPDINEDDGLSVEDFQKAVFGALRRTLGDAKANDAARAEGIPVPNSQAGTDHRILLAYSVLQDILQRKAEREFVLQFQAQAEAARGTARGGDESALENLVHFPTTRQ